jgi:hypothetical protein
MLAKKWAIGMFLGYGRSVAQAFGAPVLNLQSSHPPEFFLVVRH